MLFSSLNASRGGRSTRASSSSSSTALATMTASLPLLLTLLLTTATIAPVNAHGWVGSISIDSKSYKGPDPYGDKVGDGVIRAVQDEQPVTDMTSKETACGRGDPGAAPKFATAKPGSEFAVTWVDGSGQPKWPHDIGPLMTYMASCDSDACAGDATSYKFFKILEAGQDPAPAQTWAQGDTVYKGKPYTFQLPSDIPSGKYLMRHEIIAIQNGAELYPSCFNIEVQGSSSGDGAKALTSEVPSDEMVVFPGAYKKSDPGLQTWSYDPSQKYSFPGPQIPSFISSGGGSAAVSNGTDSGSSSSSSSSSSSPSASASNAPSASSSSSPVNNQGSSPTASASAPADASDSAIPTASSTPTASASSPSSSASSGSDSDGGDDGGDDGSNDGSSGGAGGGALPSGPAGYFTTYVTAIQVTVTVPIGPAQTASLPAGSAGGCSAPASVPSASASGSSAAAPTAAPDNNAVAPKNGSDGSGSAAAVHVLDNARGAGLEDPPRARRDAKRAHANVIKRRAARWST